MAQVKDLLVQGQAKFLRKVYFQDQAISNVAQGTAPFVVASTTVVSNLNSDYLDGYHASGLFTALSANSTLSITIGGTTLTSSINAVTVDGKYISNYYTKSEADDRFVNVTGDTMSGQLYINLGGSNKPSLRWNKGGSYCGGLGYNDEINTNTFGSVDTNGAWVNTDTTDIWKFRGSIVSTSSITSSSGFIKNGLDDTYILQAGGGAKLESSLNVSSSKYLETWYSDGSKTYSTNYMLKAQWETKSICKLLISGYYTKVDYAIDADTVDGYHASGLFTLLDNDSNQLSITVGGINKKLTVAYSTHANTALKLFENPLPADTDLNTLVDPKFYVQGGANSCASMINGPIGRSNGEMWFMTLPVGANGYGQQLYYSRGGTNWELWTRSFYSTSSFTNWVQFIHSGNYSNYVYSKDSSDNRYVLKSGDTISNSSFGSQLTIKRTSDGGDAVIKFQTQNTINGYIGVRADLTPVFYSGNNTSGTGNLIWHSGNDGSGSGLDADLLDGHDSSYFSISTHSHTLSQITNKTTQGNAFNFIDNDQYSEFWLNYAKSGDTALSNTINIFHLGTGSNSGTYAKIKTDGFIKNSSSDSYFLLGGGGHVQTSNYSLSSHTHDDLYAKRTSLYCRVNTTSNKWYRIAISKPNASSYVTAHGIIEFADYTGTGGSPGILKLQIGFAIGQSPTITVLNYDNWNSTFWTEARIRYNSTWASSHPFYVEIKCGSGATDYPCGSYLYLVNSEYLDLVACEEVTTEGNDNGILTVSVPIKRQTLSNKYFNGNLTGNVTGIATGNVTELSINENYLRWTKNNINTDLTIPYATHANTSTTASGLSQIIDNSKLPQRLRESIYGYSFTSADDFLISGWTKANGNDNSTNPFKHIDNSVSFILQNIGYDNSWSTQIASSWYKNVFATRVLSNGVWSNWAELISWNTDLDNCNSVIKTGIFTYNDFSNRPVDVSDWGTLFNLKLYRNNNNYHRQLFFDCYGTDKIWTRSNNGGSWTSWKELITSSNWSTYINLTSLGAASSTHTHTYLIQESKSDADDAMPIGNAFQVYHMSNSSADGGDGHIMSFTWSDSTHYGAQIYIDTGPTGKMSFRQRSGASVWTDWNKIIHSNNYTTWINTINFPGLNKVGTVTSITVQGSDGVSGSGTITTSGTITLSNSGVRSTTINGNYLRVNTNGTNADLTIPYASNAGKLDNTLKGDLFSNLGTDTTNAISATIGGTIRNITVTDLSTSLNLNRFVEYKDTSIPNGEGWYRIAETTNRYATAWGVFQIFDTGTGSASHREIHVTITIQKPGLSQIGGSQWSNTFQKVRILYMSDWSSSEKAYLEVYSSGNIYGGHSFYSGYGWTCYDTASISTYDQSTDSHLVYELTLNNDAITAQSFYGTLYGSSSSVRDTGNSNVITFEYSGNGFTSAPTYLAAWDGYKLRYVANKYVSVNFAASAGYTNKLQSLGDYAFSNIATDIPTNAVSYKIITSGGTALGDSQYNVLHIPWSSGDCGTYLLFGANYGRVGIKYKHAGDVRELPTVLTTSGSNVTSLDCKKYSSIYVARSSSQTMSLSTTPNEGMECHIVIYNSGSSNITITLPSSYRRNVSSITIAASAFGEVNVMTINSIVHVRAV